jgi:uncharacterized protein (DUF3820 family)
MAASSNKNETKYASKITISELNEDLNHGCKIATKVSEYRMPLGKYKGLGFTDIPAQSRGSYLKYIQMKCRIVTQLYIGAFLKDAETICDELQILEQTGALYSKFFLTFGKYRGIPLDLVEVENPGYCKWLTNSEFSSNLSAELISKLKTFIH